MPTPANWPIGVIARVDPATAADAIVDCLATDRIRTTRTERLVALADLLAECAAGSGEAASSAVERVSDTLDLFWRPQAYPELLSLFRERHPTLQWLLVYPTVRMFSLADMHGSVHLDVLELLGHIAEDDPDIVRGAIVSEFGSADAFLSAEAGGIGQRQGLAEQVFDCEFDTWHSDLLEYLKRAVDADWDE